MLTFVVPVKNDLNQKHLYLMWISKALSRGMHVVLVFDGQGKIEIPSELSNLVNQYPESLEIEKVFFGNPGETRNRGLGFVKTSWVAFVDSDDFVYVDEFWNLVQETIAAKKSIGVGNFISKKGDTKNSVENYGSNHLFGRIKYPGLWRYIFLTDRIGKLKFYATSGGEDIAFLCGLKIKLGEVHVSKRLVYQYNLNVPGQLTKVVDMRPEIKNLRKQMRDKKVQFFRMGSFSILLRIQLFVQYLILHFKGFFLG